MLRVEEQTSPLFERGVGVSFFKKKKFRRGKKNELEENADSTSCDWVSRSVTDRHFTEPSTFIGSMKLGSLNLQLQNDTKTQIAMHYYSLIILYFYRI